ncbi:hypothetical protein Scep_002591 [Stephania cephalantha]|uniref:PsbP C-terminal domain-containing protein n=1 Tax=Stephania cephalantha TaxID=152367 RepID=A0AAP0LCZ5_9MAGN
MASMSPAPRPVMAVEAMMRTWSIAHVASTPITLFSSTTTMAEPIQVPTKKNTNKTQSLSVTKRTLSVSTLLGIPITTISLLFSAAADETQSAQLGLERYIDSKEGFTLLVPSSWVKVEKAGATVLFEEANKGSNNVGVVVSPVRLNSLSEFGSPQFVADKLIQAEKRKESTKDAEVIGVSERQGHQGFPVYEFEYKVDSTRGGLKRLFSAVFVASKKLYILNITHSDQPANPLDDSKRMMLEQVLHSFDTVGSL